MLPRPLGGVGGLRGGGGRCCRLYCDVTASALWSSRACALLGVDIVMADFFPATLTSMKRMVSSTHRSWSGCLRRSSWISASARPMHSWSATRSSPWFTIPSQLGHFFKKRHTSACPRRRAANARMGSVRSCVILDRATRATFVFSAVTARDFMAASNSFSVMPSIGKGPTAFLVTSRLRLESQHSSNCMVRS